MPATIVDVCSIAIEILDAMESDWIWAVFSVEGV
jgi:hypothetical protein